MLAPDIRDITLEVTDKCECGSIAFQPQWVSFADWKIAAYSLYMKCVFCDKEYLAPTEIDDPEFVRE